MTRIITDRKSEHLFIKLDDITLRVSDKRLFENTRWEILSGQQWAIIGPNGSGKSLLVNALCHKVPVVHGRILYFFEQDGGNSHDARSYLNKGEVVMVSPDTHQEFMQQYSLYHQARWQSFEGRNVPTVSDLLTGKSIEHVSPYEVTPFRVSEEVYQARRQHALELLGIEYLLERKILHISHGESRKVHIARALMQSPQLLILDDPFCGLDNASRETLLRAIEELLAAESPCILFVTPRFEEIPKGITHVLGVENSRIVAQGLQDAILSEFPAWEGQGVGKTCLSMHTVSEPTSHPSQEGNLAISPRKNLPLKASQEGNAGRMPTFPGGILVEMKNTSVAYGGVQVLRNIDWTMKQGEHWAILGHNGAGKTTLLSLILADNPQSYANDITIFDIPRGSGESIWDIKQHIGWVSPELQIYYHTGMTCHNVVCSGFFDSIGLYRQCSPEQRDNATAWMQSLGIEQLSDQLFSRLSAGEQRLILLARALTKNPTLLILDEPCQGLDAQHRIHILNLLDQLCQQTSVSIIFVTHHFDEMPDAITHVLKLEHGQILECDTRRRILG